MNLYIVYEEKSKKFYNIACFSFTENVNIVCISVLCMHALSFS